MGRIAEIARRVTGAGRPSAVTVKRRSGRRLARVLLAALLLLTALALAVALNAQRLVPYAVAAISDATGRKLRIEGPVKVTLLSWRPHLRIEKLKFANAEWSRNPDMLDVGLLRVSLSLRRLLHFDVAFPQVRVENAVALLEERGDGTNNWSLGPGTNDEDSSRDRSSVPSIRRLRLRNAHVSYTNEGRPQANVDIVFDDATGRLARAVLLNGRGRYQKLPARFDIKAGSIAELHDKSKPFPLDASLQAGDTSASIKGNIVGAGAGIDGTMKLSGDSLSKLYPLIGVVLPPSPPYTVEGRLVHDDKVWSFEKFKGRMGDSDLGGDVKVDTAPKRPKMTAEFRSSTLDLDDLGGLVGAPPKTGPGETASAEQKAQAAALARDPRLLPDTAVDVPRLQAMDIDARLLATRVITPKRLPIDKLDLRFKLENGTLKATPAEFDVAGGRVNMFVTLHSDRTPLAVQADVRARGLLIARLLGDTPFTDETHGRLGGDIDLAMRGNSVREMAATADGTAKLAMSDAQVSHLLVELIGLDVMQAIGVVLEGDEPLPVRCGAFALTAKNGKARSDVFVIDTDDTNFTGNLELDLASEHFDLELDPHPKDVSLLSLRQKLRAEGTFKKPSVYPDPLDLGPVPKLVQKVNMLLAPLVGLLTPVDTGAQKGDNGCSAFLREQSEQGNDSGRLAGNERPVPQKAPPAGRTKRPPSQHAQ